MSDVLARICDDKRDEVALRKSRTGLAELEAAIAAASAPRGFADALERRSASHGIALIAEIKKASPSAGLIRPDFDPPALAEAYRTAGASCLSVLTDAPYFQGDDAYLKAARAAVPLPVLRKDFMIDPWQVAEARAIGADCILVIMAAVDDGLAGELVAEATRLGMDSLIEVHDATELERGLRLPARLIGINNRNLKTLVTDIATTEQLAGRVPEDRLLVAESGLRTPADLDRVRMAGARAILVGESLMRQDDVTGATRQLLGAAAA